jgi:hypothetical protein
MSPLLRRPIATLNTIVLTLAAFAVSMFATLAPPAQASTTPGYPGRILFDSNRDGYERTYSIKADGTDLRLEAPTSTIHFPDSFAAQYAPQAARLAFVATYDDGLGFYKRGLAVRDVAARSTSIYSPHYFEGQTQCLDVAQPTWSPDGGSIAFACKRAGVYPDGSYSDDTIWVTTSADFTHARKLTFNGITPTVDEWPSWSPDGATVVFQSSLNGDHDFKIETVHAADGSGRTTIASVANPGGVFNPEYSPDGTKVLYEVRATADWSSNELWLMNADGSGKTRLTHDAVWEGFPTWAPDGRHLLLSYHSAGCNCDTLAIMKPSASDVPHVIGGTWNSANWNNYAPHWQQLPDTVPPTAPTITGAHTFTLNNVTLHYSSTDAGSGIRAYQVRTGRSAWNSSTWTWSGWSTRTTTTYTSPAIAAGYTYCFQIRAVDRANNPGPARQVCTSRPLEDNQTAASAGWARVMSKYFYSGAASKTTVKGASLSLRTFYGDRIGLLVRTCSSCGSVHVYLNSVLYRTLSTYSSTTRYRVWRSIPRFTATSGRIRIVTTSNKPVYIDGIGMSKR